MEFIENAEGFYNGITFLKRALLDARVKKDEKKEKEMISEMESYLFHLKQFLGTIMERKDNIVDLGEVWYSVDEEPDRTQDILIDSYTVGYYVPTTISFSDEKWSHCISYYAIKRWAYIKDLMPKGGEK